MAVQVAADVRELDQVGQTGAAVQSRGLELAAILAQLRLDVGEAEQLVQLGLARAGSRPADGVVEQPVLGDVQPSPHRAFAQRRVVLARAGEVLQQVAELRGLGDAQIDAHAGVRARPRAGLPAELTLSICSSLARLLASVVGRVVTAIRSMSLTLSAPRRAEPASCTWVPGLPCSVRPATSASPSSIALGSSRRGAARSPAPCSSAASTLASSLGPSPRTVRRRCCSAASRSFSSESMPSSECSSRARFGPRPGRRVIAIRPGGNFARSRSAAGIVPVSSSARIFSCSVVADPPAARSPGPARQRRHRHRCLAHRSWRPRGRRARGGRSPRRARTGRPAPPERRRSPRWEARSGSRHQGTGRTARAATQAPERPARSCAAGSRVRRPACPASPG